MNMVLLSVLSLSSHRWEHKRTKGRFVLSRRGVLTWVLILQERSVGRGVGAVLPGASSCC